MLLAIDIGNSNVKFGVYDEENLLKKFSIPTVRRQTAEEMKALIEPFLTENISAVIVSSVVPELKRSIEDFSKNHLAVSPVFVSHEMNFGLKINYESPETLGIDRAVAAFAAREKYGAPCVVCNFGTATTVDAVNLKGEFAGGVIVAGINLLADALFQKTSRLPKVEIKRAEKVLENSTAKAINAGIYFGYIGLMKEIVERMSNELGEKPKVVATGGLATIIFNDAFFLEIYDENLMLDGLYRIYKNSIFFSS